MNMNKLPVGNAFQFLTDERLILTAFRCKEIEYQHIVPCMLFTNYFLLAKTTQVSSIVTCQEFESGLGTKQASILIPPVKCGELSSMDPGLICQIMSHTGSSRWIMVLERHAYGSHVVAGIGSAQGLPPNTLVQDLGPAWKFDSIPDYITSARICPNCHQLSLMETDTDNECLCMFCNIKVSFSW